MKYLITGGAGFIGSNFIRILLRENEDIKIVNLDKLTYSGNLENLKDVENDPRYTFIHGDICNYELVSKIMKDVDIVVNFAADTHVDRSINFDGAPFILTDVYGTYILLRAAKENKNLKRFHQISTDEVYGDLPQGYFAKEDDKLSGNSPYSASKAGADLQVMAFYRTYNLPVTISRCTNNYGPYQYPEKLIPLFITNLLEDKKVPLYDNGTQIRDWLYVDDHCKAILTILEKGKIGEIYNIGANQTPEITNLEITKILLKYAGKDESYIKYVYGLRPGHDQRYAVDTSKIRKLGWKPEVDINTGLKLTFDWYKKNTNWWKALKNEEFKKFYKKHYKMED